MINFEMNLLKVIATMHHFVLFTAPAPAQTGTAEEENGEGKIGMFANDFFYYFSISTILN